MLKDSDLQNTERLAPRPVTHPSVDIGALRLSGKKAPRTYSDFTEITNIRINISYAALSADVL